MQHRLRNRINIRVVLKPDDADVKPDLTLGVSECGLTPDVAHA